MTGAVEHVYLSGEELLSMEECMLYIIEQLYNNHTKY